MVSTVVGAMIFRTIETLPSEFTPVYNQTNESNSFTTSSLLLSSSSASDLSTRLPDGYKVNTMFVSSHTLRMRAAGTLTLLVGLVQLTLSLLRLGNLFGLLAPIALRSFCAATAIHVIATQISFLFGYRVQHHHGSLRLFYVLVLHTNNVMFIEYMINLRLLQVCKNKSNSLKRLNWEEQFKVIKGPSKNLIRKQDLHDRIAQNLYFKQRL